MKRGISMLVAGLCLGYSMAVFTPASAAGTSVAPESAQFPHSQLSVGAGRVLAGVGERGQSPERTLMKGHGRATTGVRPREGEPFRLLMSDTPERGFIAVPPGRVFVLTDVMFTAQLSVREPVVVNVSIISPYEREPRILFQQHVEPRTSKDLHLCTGYVVPEGHSLIAYTGASYGPQQHVSISLTGSLTTR